MNWNWIGLIVTVLIIALGVFHFVGGQQPTWFMWFIGWGIVLSYDIKNVMK